VILPSAVTAPCGSTEGLLSFVENAFAVMAYWLIKGEELLPYVACNPPIKVTAKPVLGAAGEGSAHLVPKPPAGV
jgi:hypothetical protein